MDAVLEDIGFLPMATAEPQTRNLVIPDKEVCIGRGSRRSDEPLGQAWHGRAPRLSARVRAALLRGTLACRGYALLACFSARPLVSRCTGLSWVWHSIAEAGCSGKHRGSTGKQLRTIKRYVREDRYGNNIK